MTTRRAILLLPLILPLGSARAEDGAWALLRQPGAIVLFRHAHAPGTGDPAGFTLGDCATQRNLDHKGRAEAEAIGAAFRARQVSVGRVVSSQWCRARETAELAFGGRVEEQPAFNSFFGDRSTEPEATREALAFLGSWGGPGVLAVVTHQVNITALTGEVPRPAEGLVVRLENGRVMVQGRLPPPPI